FFFFFFQAEDGIRDGHVTGVQTCALPISNYANSPLPVGPIDPSLAGFLVMNGGSGYVAPVVTITDFYNTPGASPPASCTATVTEIGRASCRERVRVSGGGGAAKDKRERH